MAIELPSPANFPNATPLQTSMSPKRHAHLIQLPIAIGIACTLPACSIKTQQGLQAVGGMLVHENYKEQSKRLCAQQIDSALRFQCEQKAQKDFEKFQKQTGEKP
jgi:hypothetical protein